MFYASFILRNFGGGRGRFRQGKPRQMWTSAEHAQKIAGGDVDNRTHGGAAAHPSPGQSNRCRRHLPYGETEDARNVWRQFHRFGWTHVGIVLHGGVNSNCNQDYAPGFFRPRRIQS